MTKSWDKYKDAIICLYKEQNLPLREVRKILKEQHGFIASTRAYRTRLDRWAMRKYNCKKWRKNSMTSSLSTTSASFSSMPSPSSCSSSPTLVASSSEGGISPTMPVLPLSPASISSSPTCSTMAPVECYRGGQEAPREWGAMPGSLRRSETLSRRHCSGQIALPLGLRSVPLVFLPMFSARAEAGGGLGPSPAEQQQQQPPLQPCYGSCCHYGYWSGQPAPMFSFSCVEEALPVGPPRYTEHYPGGIVYDKEEGEEEEEAGGDDEQGDEGQDGRRPEVDIRAFIKEERNA